MKDFDFNYKINLFYNNRKGLLDIKANSNPPSTKFFPIYEVNNNDYIFKPLSYTKPFATPFFCYSEFFWSYYIKKYFDSNMPLYELAICEGITESEKKYRNIGNLVENYLKDFEIDKSLYECFNINQSDNVGVNIKNYDNYCMEFYDYIPIFESSFFSKREDLKESLARNFLISLLTRNENFHYENNRFICNLDGNVKKMAPPIDNEFSMMFMFLDDDISYELYHDYFEFLLVSDSVINKNLRYVVKNYPDVCSSFLESIEQFNMEIEEKPVVILPCSFIGRFRSRDYLVYSALIKEGDVFKAKRLNEELVYNEINYDLLGGKITEKILRNNNILKGIISNFMDKDKVREYNKVFK